MKDSFKSVDVTSVDVAEVAVVSGVEVEAVSTVEVDVTSVVDVEDFYENIFMFCGIESHVIIILDFFQKLAGTFSPSWPYVYCHHKWVRFRILFPNSKPRDYQNDNPY